MQYQWFFNIAKGRFELSEKDPTSGATRVVAVHAPAGADISDLPQGVQFVPLDPTVAATVQAAQAGDQSATPHIQGMLQALSESSATQPNMDVRAPNGARVTPAGQTTASGQQTAPADAYAMRDTPDQIRSQVAGVNNALSAHESASHIIQGEHTLEQAMLAAGQRPSDFFGQSATGTGTGASATGLPGQSEADSFAGRMPVDYANAYNDVSAATIRAALINRADRLQQATNAFAAQQAGEKRLTTQHDMNANLATMGHDLAWQEHLDDANPKQDKNLTTTADGRSVHSGDAATASQFDQLKEQRRQWMATNDPAGFMNEEQQRMARQPTQAYQNWTPPDGMTPNPGGTGGYQVPPVYHNPYQPTPPHQEEYMPYANGGQMPPLPRYADGGWSGSGDWGGSSSSWNGGQVAANTGQTYTSAGSTNSETSGLAGVPGPAANVDAQNQVWQRQQDQTAYERELQLIQQDTATKIQAIDAQFAQQVNALKSQVPLIQQSIAQQLAAIKQQQGAASSEHTLAPLTRTGAGAVMRSGTFAG